MDVHDVGDYQKPLAAGMTFVVEPGIYVRPQALDNLADTPENRAFKEAVRRRRREVQGHRRARRGLVPAHDDRPEAPVGDDAADDRGDRTPPEDDARLARRSALTLTARTGGRHFFQTRSAKSAKRSQSYGVRSWPPVRT